MSDVAPIPGKLSSWYLWPNFSRRLGVRLRPPPLAAAAPQPRNKDPAENLIDSVCCALLLTISHGIKGVASGCALRFIVAKVVGGWLSFPPDESTPPCTP